MNHRLQGALIGGAIVAAGLFLSSLSLQQPASSAPPRGATTIRLRMHSVSDYMPQALVDAGGVPGTAHVYTFDKDFPESAFSAIKGRNLRVAGAQWVDDMGTDPSIKAPSGKVSGWRVLMVEDVVY